MVLPVPPYTGACLCGAIQVHVTAPPLLTLACHCRSCQKFTASAYSLTTMFPHDAVSCTGDLIRGGLHSEGRTHLYCKSCLTFVYSRLAGAAHRINLRTSVLDAAARFKPFVEVMTDDKMPWVNLPVAHSFARHPTSPEDLQGLMDAYQASEIT